MEHEDISICDMDVMDEEAIDARLARSEAARCSLRHGTGSGGQALAPCPPSGLHIISDGIVLRSSTGAP
jgi:hypothetical protein